MGIREITRASGKSRYVALMEHVDERTRAVGAGQTVEVGETQEVARFLIDQYAESSELLELAMGYYEPADLVISHAVNVTALALRMGLDLGVEGDDLEDLVAAALLHDIGFGRAPIFHRSQSDLMAHEAVPRETLTAEDRQAVERHPEIGAAAIVRDSERAERIARLILQHHETDDGSGYPSGLRKGEQVLPARILSILDVYEALVHPRPFRDALVPPAGIEAIKKGERGIWDADLLRALLRSFSLFPVGHFVLLSNGAVARVRATYPDHPLRPDVEVVVDANGTRLPEPRPVSLRKEQTLGISQALPRFRPS